MNGRSLCASSCLDFRPSEWDTVFKAGISSCVLDICFVVFHVAVANLVFTESPPSPDQGIRIDLNLLPVNIESMKKSFCMLPYVFCLFCAFNLIKTKRL